MSLKWILIVVGTAIGASALTATAVVFLAQRHTERTAAASPETLRSATEQPRSWREWFTHYCVEKRDKGPATCRCAAFNLDTALSDSAKQQFMAGERTDLMESIVAREIFGCKDAF